MPRTDILPAHMENSQINAISVTGTALLLNKRSGSAGSGLTSTAVRSHGRRRIRPEARPANSVGRASRMLSIASMLPEPRPLVPADLYAGSAVVNLVTPLIPDQLTVEYTRTDGNVIEVADDASIAALPPYRTVPDASCR